MKGGLTPKQEKFCTEYIACGNASEAYRSAYNCENMKPVTVNRKAFDLQQNGKITARIQELQNGVAQEASVTLVGHLDDLKQLRDEARAAGQFGSAINAEIARGKAVGLYKDRIEVNGDLDITQTLLEARSRAAVLR